METCGLFHIFDQLLHIADYNGIINNSYLSLNFHVEWPIVSVILYILSGWGRCVSFPFAAVGRSSPNPNRSTNRASL